MALAGVPALEKFAQVWFSEAHGPCRQNPDLSHFTLSGLPGTQGDPWRTGHTTSEKEVHAKFGLNLISVTKFSMKKGNKLLLSIYNFPNFSKFSPYTLEA